MKTEVRKASWPCWSPVTESNRRPSPYHVQLSRSITRASATDQQLRWHTQAETSPDQQRRAPLCPSNCPPGAAFPVPAPRSPAGQPPVRAQQRKYTLRRENTAKNGGQPASAQHAPLISANGILLTCRIECVACTHAYALTGMFTLVLRAVRGLPRFAARRCERQPGPAVTGLSRPPRGSLPARRRSGSCVKAAGAIIRSPPSREVAACEQYEVPGGDDAGEVDDELEG